MFNGMDRQGWAVAQAEPAVDNAITDPASGGSQNAPEISSAADDAASSGTVPPTASEVADPFSNWLGLFDVASAADIVTKGGPVVVILLALSMIAFTVAFVKFFQFVGHGVGSGGRARRAVAHFMAGREDVAYGEVCRAKAPSAVALAHALRGLSRGVPENVLREDVERVSIEQLGAMRSYLRVLESTVQIAPLLGLFGTVIGMISAFRALQDAGAQADPAVLAGGIWVALLTTAVGLAIAMPIALFNAFFEGRLEREREIMESTLTSLFTRQATDRDVYGETSDVSLTQAAE